MREIFVVSDTHFGHANIIKYCNRPFTSVEEMDEAMIERWNSVVKDQDIVYHLGDVYFGAPVSNFQHRLKGRKRLILGNHDTATDALLLKHFQKITMWRMFPEFGLLLTHVPVHYSALFKTPVNVHGHIHEKVLDEGQYVNVSVERINYTPVSIEELRYK